MLCFFFVQAEDGIRDLVRSRGLGDVYKRQVVAHNAPFDLMIIKKEDINPKKFICTLRVTRELDKEGKIDRYNLQYLSLIHI